MDGRRRYERMRKSLTIYGLLMLVIACMSCKRENTEYGETPQQPAPIVGTLTFETMRVTLNPVTEIYTAVVRPSATTTAAEQAIPMEMSDTRAESNDLNDYRFRLIDKSGTIVAEFPYGAQPSFELPTGVYTLTAEPQTMPTLAWDEQTCTATQEVYVRKDVTTEVGEVVCTPVTIGVALTFDETFAATSEAAVEGNGEKAIFTPAETRTAYFLLPEGSRNLNFTVKGMADGAPIDFTQTISNLRPGCVYHFTVKGSAVTPPVIEWEGHDINQRYEATEELQAKINITAVEGIREFKVEIISEVLTPEVLEGINLTTNFDLINPGKYGDALEGLGFPTGDDVLNQTFLSFDISPFMPLIPLLGTGNSDFKLTVSDNGGATTVASIMVHSTKEGENPDPDGPEQEFPGGDASPLDPPSSGTKEPFPGGPAGEL